MAKVKRGILYVLASMLCVLTCLFFAACGASDKYKNVKLSVSTESVSLYVGQTTILDFKIENYIEKMDNSLNFTVTDSSSSNSSSEHIAVKTISAIEENIKVEISGISSGRSTLIATTNEGFKQARVDVIVKQYSKDFEVDSTKTMYIAKGDILYPSASYFKFDEGTTERDLSFYYSKDKTDNTDGKTAFSYVSFDEASNKILFFDENSELVYDAGICATDGQVYYIVAVYDYKEIDENGLEVSGTIKKVVPFIALHGINDSDIQIYEKDESTSSFIEVSKENHQVDIVVRRTSSDKKEYFITVPKMTNSINLDFGFSYSIADYEALDIQSEFYTQEKIDAIEDASLRESIVKFKESLGDDLDLYKLVLSAKTSNATKTNLSLKVFYQFSDETDLSQEFNSKVNNVTYLPVQIQLMPEKLEIENIDKNVITGNNFDEGNIENEIYYNFYAGADFGWNEYYVNVYKTSSTFTGVEVQFDHTRIQVRYAGRLYNNTFLITDLSQPILIKGIDGISVNGEKESISFVVKSGLFRAGEELSAVLNYEICDGASRIYYENEIYKNNGISVALSSQEETFAGLYADHIFKSFTLETQTPGIVSIGNHSVENIEDKYFLKFDLVPIKMGRASYIVRLDNGVSLAITVDVVETFDDFFISLEGSNEDVVVFEKTKDEYGIEKDGEYNLVLKNNNAEGGKSASFSFGTTYMNSVQAENLMVNIADFSIISLETSNKDFIKTISTTSTGGETIVTFVLSGVKVEGFLKTIQTREIKINAVSFVPVSDIAAYVVDQITLESTRADNVVVYAKAEASNKNTANINVVINPVAAYSFYDMSQAKYVNDSNAEQYVYWTLSDGIYAYSEEDVKNEAFPLARTTIYEKGVYYISGRSSFSEDSYYGIFEYDSINKIYRFMANKNYASGANFTMYASIRQYGLKKYYPVNISCEKFVAVEQIYLGSNITEYAFKNADELLEFVVYLNPYEATEKGLRLIYEKVTGLELIDVTNTEFVKITKQATTTANSYIVQIKLDKNIVNAIQGRRGTNTGVLYAVPEDWCTSANGFSAVAIEKRNQVVAINISFQNGTYDNPYVLRTASDVQAIASAQKGLEAHYIVYNMIDLSSLTLPIEGIFTGTIRGANDKAGFKNINLTRGYALFESIAPNKDGYYNIENLTFEGSINLNDIKGGNIGLVAQTFTGKAMNITASLSEFSTIQTTQTTTNTFNIGTLFGQMSSGVIAQDFTRYYINIAGHYYPSANFNKRDGEYFENAVSPSEDNYFKLGTEYYLITDNVVEIEGKKYEIFNVVKNLVYSENRLEVFGTIETLNVGGIVGQITGGEIKQIYNDKITYTNYAAYSVFTNIKVLKIKNSRIGGVVGSIEGNATINNLKVGGQAKFDISYIDGAASGNFVGGIVGRILASSSVTNNISRVFVSGYNVGGIAGGKTNGINMISTLGNKVQAVDEDQKGIRASLIIKIGSSGTYNLLSNETYKTFVKRSFRQVVGIKVNITTPINDNEFFGDFVVVEPSDTSGNIVRNEVFDASTVEALDVELKNTAFNTAEEIITYAYYYGANAYYKEGELVYTNLVEKQQLLNVLNTYSSTDIFTINGEGLSITSTSDNISIDSSGNITLLYSSREPAKIVVSSILNMREKKTIYLYVINYFNAESYISGSTNNLFYLNGNALTSTSKFSVISNKNLTFAMNPKMENVEKGINNDKTISISNNVIELVSANSYIDFDVAFESGSDSFGEIEKYQDGFFFAKKSGVETTHESVDNLIVKAYLSVIINGESYKLDLVELTNIKAEYREGATKIASNYASYVVVTGDKIRDKILIKSDIEETLHYVITDFTGGIVTKGYINGTSTTILKTGLFNITGSGVDNKFDVEIAVDKESEMFKNRFTQNIYGKYFVKYYTETKGENGICLQMPINFEEQEVNTINLASYNNMADFLNTGNVYESNDVLLKEYGLLSVSLAPIDADFDYIKIENDAINYLDGSAAASFVFGIINEETKQFEPVYSSNPTSNGIRITKENIESAYGLEYKGQFYIRYLFSSTKAVNEAPVKINVSIFKNNDMICENLIDLKINRQYQIGLKLNGYENKKYVARGLSYELEVINTGYDINSLKIYVEDEYKQYASIRETNGQYYLDISNSELNVSGREGQELFVSIDVERKNEKGELVKETEKLSLTILNFVINYQYEENVFEDIISGMENGIISTAVGEATTLSVNFKDYSFIEYNGQNTSVKTEIINFINNLDRNGSWKIYLDINDANEKIYDNPIEDLNMANQKTLNTNTRFDNIYYLSNGLTFRTKRTHSPSEGHYIFTYQAKYAIENGSYVLSESPSAYQINTKFTFDSFIRGSDENPNPITSYAQFKDMKAGASYILMNDIRINSEEFEPVSTAIASFDGNGFKFIFSNFSNEENPSNLPSTFDCTNMTEIGLFANIAKGTVIKNVTVQIGDENSGNVVFKLSTSSVTVGFIAATIEDGGVLTNASVLNFDGCEVVISDNQDPGSILGSVVGVNSGFITHSRSSLSFKCNFSSAGFVGTNNGLIASSFYKGGKITNQVSLTSTNIYSAGFAITNNGRISASYTSKSEASIIYENVINWNTEKENADIESTVLTAGFVYRNGEDAQIDDCYSNLTIKSSTNTAGFVYENEGVCRNSISFSLVNPNLHSQYGFAASSVRTNGFENCFYLRDADKNINTEQNFVNIVGVEYKNIEEFSNYESFSTFSVSNGENSNYVWNYLSELGRMELVDANLIAFSQKLLDVTKTTYAPDGTPIYSYYTSDTSARDGDITNPYIISNPEKFENFISVGNTSGKYYRIVCDLDYGSYETNFAKTYDVAFAGYLFGNGMVIKNISLYSDSFLDYAGLFAKIQGSAFKNACVKDLTVIPVQVSFANTKVVGGLCGLANQADIFNVSVLGNDVVEQDDEEENETKEEHIAVVIGKNIVGGVVGLGQGNYSIDNVTIKISTMSKYVTLIKDDHLPTQNESLFVESYLDSFSYSGGAVGFLGGYGQLKNVYTRKAGVTTIGASAGNITGFIGKNAIVKNLEVKMHENMTTRAFIYGGIVSGVTYGTIENVDIFGTGDDLDLFSSVPYMPYALGGLTGYLTGSKDVKVSNVYMGQSLVMPYEDGFSVKAPSYVGGLVGEVGRMNSSDVTIEKVKVDGNISATNILGGVVGVVGANTTLILKEIAITEVVFALSGRNANPVLANFVGLVAGNIKISDAYSFATLTIDCFDYENVMNANIGELIGKTDSLSTTALNSLKLLLVENVYIKNTYEVFLVDKSAVDPAVKETFDDTPSVPPAPSTSYEEAVSSRKIVPNGTTIKNIFTDGYLGGFTYRKNESQAADHISVDYYRLLSSTSNTDIKAFATNISNNNWYIVETESGEIELIILDFENNL